MRKIGLTKEGIQQKIIVERIIAQGGTAFADDRVKLASGDSIIHHCRHKLRYAVLTCSASHPVDEQLEHLFDLRELHYIKLVARTPQDSALTDSAATFLLDKKLKLDYLFVEGATCSNANLRGIRDKLPSIKGYIKTSRGFKLSLSNKSIAAKLFDDVLFRDGFGESTPSLTQR